MTPTWYNEIRLEHTMPRVLAYREEITSTLKESLRRGELDSHLAAQLASRFPQLEAIAILQRDPEALGATESNLEIEQILEIAEEPPVRRALEQAFPPEQLSLSAGILGSHEATEYDRPYVIDLDQSKAPSDRETALRLNIEFQEERGNSEAQAQSYLNLLDLLRSEGRIAEAVVAGEHAIGLWEKIGEPSKLVMTHLTMSDLVTEQGSLSRGVLHLRKALAWLQNIVESEPGLSSLEEKLGSAISRFSAANSLLFHEDR